MSVDDVELSVSARRICFNLGVIYRKVCIESTMFTGDYDPSSYRRAVWPTAHRRPLLQSHIQYLWD